jgi:hypothetical protein
VYINSGTSANMNSSTVPATNVTGAVMKIYDPATPDGVHPGPVAAEALAGVMPTNYVK